MALYISFFIILAILSFIEMFSHYPDKYKKYTINIFTCIYIFLTSIYAGPQGDYIEYKKYFIGTDLSHLYMIRTNRFEYLYEVANVLVRIFTDNYQIFRFVVGILVIGLWRQIYKYWENAMIHRYAVTILFVAWTFNFGSIFIIRSTIATAICLYSIRFIEQKNRKCFLICTILAMGFHLMAFVWLLSYFIYYKTEWRKYYYVCIALAFTFSAFLPSFINKIASHLGASMYRRISANILRGTANTYGIVYTSSFIMLKALANMILLFLLFQYMLFRKRKIRILGLEENYTNLYIVGAVIYIISFFTSLTLGRAALPYTNIQIFLLPQIFSLPEIGNKGIVKFIAFAVMVIYLFSRMYITLNSAGYVPFNTIL